MLSGYSLPGAKFNLQQHSVFSHPNVREHHFDSLNMFDFINNISAFLEKFSKFTKKRCSDDIWKTNKKYKQQKEAEKKQLEVNASARKRNLTAQKKLTNAINKYELGKYNYSQFISNFSSILRILSNSILSKFYSVKILFYLNSILSNSILSKFYSVKFYSVKILFCQMSM